MGLAKVNMIVTDFSILIVNIQSSITVIESPLTEEVKLEVLQENMEIANTTLDFIDQVLGDPMAATAEGTVEMTWMHIFELVSSLYTTISLDYLFMGNQCPPPLPPIDMGMGYGYGPSTSGLSSTGSTAGSTEMEITTAESMETNTEGSTMMETTTTIDME